MTMQQVIEKAIEGGWEDNAWCSCISPKRIIAIAFLDPLFWQALGKGMGWKEWICKSCGISYQVFKEGSSCNDCRRSERPMESEENGSWQKTWLYHWHRLIDRLSEGESIESFFEQY